MYDLWIFGLGITLLATFIVGLVVDFLLSRLGFGDGGEFRTRNFFNRFWPRYLRDYSQGLNIESMQLWYGSILVRISHAMLMNYKEPEKVNEIYKQGVQAVENLLSSPRPDRIIRRANICLLVLAIPILLAIIFWPATLPQESLLTVIPIQDGETQLFFLFPWLVTGIYLGLLIFFCGAKIYWFGDSYKASRETLKRAPEFLIRARDDVLVIGK